MITLIVRNVNDALDQGLNLISAASTLQESRNGPVRVVDGPVTTLYRKPMERVLFCPARDANPFFHFMEALWMLDGRNDTKFLTQYVQRMKDFSDDGKIFHGAYGHRWRMWFEFDQLDAIVKELKNHPTSRRAVLQMWDSRQDLGRKGKDIPCNTHAYFSISQDTQRLNMTVLCRSNDMIWGAYGANAVHFSMLMEYMAARIGVRVGQYWQVSNNFHVYEDVYQKLINTQSADFTINSIEDNVYTNPEGWKASRPVYPMFDQAQPTSAWEDNLGIFLDNAATEDKRLINVFHHSFFPSVALPMYRAHQAYKKKDFQAAKDIIQLCMADDWRIAATRWLIRREIQQKKAESSKKVLTPAE